MGQMGPRPHLATVIALIGLTTLAACGGVRDLDVSEGTPVDDPSTIVHAQTGTLPKIAYAGSPVRKSRSYINSYAVEPGETWLDMGDIGDIALGGYTLRAYETQRVVPDLIFDYAPGYRPNPELEAQVRRAFKLWTRHLTGIRGTDDRLWPTVVEVGHTNACGGGAGVLACVVPINHYENPYGVPIMQIPASQAELVASANSPITLLSTLAHEAGHALDYRDFGLGYYNPETGQFEKSHAPRWAGQLMSPIRGDSVTIGPQTADLLGVRHSFTYGTALSPDHFGWWIDAPPTSNLRSFGSGVARHFDVADIAGVSHVVASSESVTSASVTSDYVKVFSWVDGLPTPPEYLDDVNLPAHLDLGSATWTGALLAVDLVDYSPVIGAASLSMNLSALRLTAEFDNFRQGPDFDAWDGPSSLRYTLTENADGVWHDRLGRVDARFFAEFNASGKLTDPAHAVAGHLDDDQAKILGAYGATRD